MNAPAARRPGPGAAVGGLYALGAGASQVVSVLSAAPQQVAALFRHRFPTVAVTGVTGVGKTRLVDRLARRSETDDLDDVGSAVMERRTRRTAKGRGFRFRVVPGDNAATRLGALDDVFHDEPVDGVMHVVAYGHATPRRAGGITGPAEATREQQLAAELQDWAITAHLIAGMAVRRDRPVWLVIVIAKTDLFPDQLEEAIRYYSPGSGSPFGDTLDELRALAGGARISIDVLPMSVPTAASASAAKRGDAQLAALDKRMAQLSGHR